MFPQHPSSGFYLFDTPIGYCAIGWTPKGIDHLQLPADSLREIEKIMADKVKGRAAVENPPKDIKKIAQRIAAHFRGKPDTFLDIKLDLSKVTPFSKKVYSALRKIPAGQTVSYGALAAKIGNADSARAVGRAMGANPIPIIIPCHRVLALNGKPGGFSAPTGISMKVKMLYFEGVILNQEHENGVRQIRKSHPVLKKVIDAVGPYLATYGNIKNPYESLVNSILYQQLSGKAASSIARKFKDMYGQGSYPEPGVMKKINDEGFRMAGVSKQKAGYLRDLATKIYSKEVDLNRASLLGDQQVIDELTKIKGIGKWSVEMFLIFHLGRLDVWPVDDLGLQKGVQRILDLKERPDKKALMEIGKQWRPYRSIATWYLWRSQGAGGVLP